MKKLVFFLFNFHCLYIIVIFFLFIFVYTERPLEQVPVNQHAYYTQQYGEALHDLNSYVHRLQQQGLVQPIDYNSAPFILTNNANGYAYPWYPSYQVEYPNYVQQPVVAGDDKQGDYHNPYNFIPNVSVDNNEKHEVNDNVSSHGHEAAKNKVVISHLNAKLQKISDNIEHKVNAIKVYVDKSVQDINKLGDDVFNHVGDKTTKIFDTINKKLERIENQLRTDDENFNLDEIEANDEVDYDMLRSLPDDDETVVDKKLDLLDSEMRGDFKNSISDAMKRAQERFNKLIEDKVTAVNNKIKAINSKVEGVFNKIHLVLEKVKLKKPTAVVNEHEPPKVYTPPTYSTTEIPDYDKKYTTIQWKPKDLSTHRPVVSANVEHVTPIYYHYTIPSHNDFFHNDLKSNNIDEDNPTKDLKRMDENVENIELVDNDKLHAVTVESNENEPKINATVDDVVENVKDTLKSDIEETVDTTASANDMGRSETHDKVDESQSKSNETIESTTANEELRNEMQNVTEHDEMTEIVEGIVPIDTVVEHPDEMRYLSEDDGEFDEEEEDEAPAPDIFNDFVNSSSNNDEDDDVDGIGDYNSQLPDVQSNDNGDKNGELKFTGNSEIDDEGLIE